MINLIYAAAAIIIFAADRLVKNWIMGNVQLFDTFGRIGQLFSFTYVRNEGAAFSMLSGRLGLLSMISVVFCVGVIVWWIIKKPTNKLLCSALTLMTAGAAGNAVDRIAHGYVVDFIKTEFIDFPIFNIADIAITVGAALIVLYVCIYDGKKK